jgi:aspartate dehydrogenase
VALLGYGAIGRVVARELLAGTVDGARLVALVNRAPVPDAPVEQVELDEALRRADLVVECAGGQALKEAAGDIAAAGRDILVTSVGALLDPAVRAVFQSSGNDRSARIRCTNGAVGGLDLLSAAAAAAPFDDVVLRTTKQPDALVQAWMDDHERARVRDAAADLLVYSGTPQNAARLFPQVLNVACAIELAVAGRVRGAGVQVELHADPAALLTRHVIEAHGPQGRYRFQIENRPSPVNPRTSGVAPYSVLQTLRGMTARPPIVA